MDKVEKILNNELIFEIEKTLCLKPNQALNILLCEAKELPRTNYNGDELEFIKEKLSHVQVRFNKKELSFEECCFLIFILGMSGSKYIRKMFDFAQENNYKFLGDK